MEIGVVCVVSGKGSPYSLSFPSIINQLTGEESGESNEFRKFWEKVLIESRVPPALFKAARVAMHRLS